MRKIFMTAAVVMAIAVAGNAQTKFGIKAGVNLAKLKESASGISITTDTKVGFNAGFFATVPVASNISFQPELLYSLEGGKVKDASSNSESKVDLSYLNVPLMLQYNASGLIVETGPQVGLLLSAKAKEDNTSTDIKDQLKSAAFSWGVGAGYRLTNGVGLHARYNFGLSNLDKDTNSGSTTKSNVFQIDLSFAFPGN